MMIGNVIKLLGTFLTILLLSVSTNAVAASWTLEEPTWDDRDICLVALHQGKPVPLNMYDNGFQDVDFVFYKKKYFAFYVHVRDGSDSLTCRAYEIVGG